MKILCLASSQPGHIDFGGKGFTCLAKQLENRGHDIQWVSFGSQPERLSQLGFKVKSLSEMSALSLLPLWDVTEIALHQQAHQQRVNSFKRLHDFFSQEQPDLLIIDRLLTYAPLIAEQLNIPYIAMGTPGGYWEFEKVDSQVHVFSAAMPINQYKTYGELLKNTLGWAKGEINSFWTRSPYLNVCFMNREFYPLNKGDKSLLASVNRHKEAGFEGKKQQQVGISFGNQGHQQVLFKCLKQAVNLPETLLPIQVFVGNRNETYTELASTYTSEQITLHRWVDFNEHFSKLSCLIFLGGVGTIWQCIEHTLPMLIIPGNIGDQRFNAQRVQTLGLGVHIKESDVDESKLSSIILQCIENSQYQNRINASKAEHNYTDSLRSICEKIENIPHL